MKVRVTSLTMSTWINTINVTNRAIKSCRIVTGNIDAVECATTVTIVVNVRLWLKKYALDASTKLKWHAQAIRQRLRATIHAKRFGHVVTVAKMFVPHFASRCLALKKFKLIRRADTKSPFDAQTPEIRRKILRFYWMPALHRVASN